MTAHEVMVSPRQWDILDAFCAGLSNARIASTLGISQDTLKTQRRRLFTALGVDNRDQAVALVNSGRVHITVRAARSP